jgi:hypothetical protein
MNFAGLVQGHLLNQKVIGQNQPETGRGNANPEKTVFPERFGENGWNFIQSRIRSFICHQ